MKEGKIVQIIGPTLDVEFDEDHLPEIYNAVEVPFEAQNTVITV